MKLEPIVASILPATAAGPALVARTLCEKQAAKAGSL